jgi:hypothetical protein
MFRAFFIVWDWSAGSLKTRYCYSNVKIFPKSLNFPSFINYCMYNIRSSTQKSINFGINYIVRMYIQLKMSTEAK